jgi:AcrR family transcriptional regulator
VFAEMTSRAPRTYRQGRRAETARATRATILAAARELFEASGFHAVGLEEVAARAGIARVTVYQAFGNKLGLLDAVAVEANASPEFARLAAALDRADPRAALVGAIRAGCAFWAAHARLVACLEALATTDEVAAVAVHRQEAGRHRALRALVGRLRAAGQLRDGLSPRDAGALLVWITGYATFAQLRDGLGLPARRVAALLVRTAEELLLTRPAPARGTRPRAPTPRRPPARRRGARTGSRTRGPAS